MGLSPASQAVRGRSGLERGSLGIHAAPERAAGRAEVRAALCAGLRSLARQGGHCAHQLSDTKKNGRLARDALRLIEKSYGGTYESHYAFDSRQAKNHWSDVAMIRPAEPRSCTPAGSSLDRRGVLRA